MNRNSANRKVTSAPSLTLLTVLTITGFASVSAPVMAQSRPAAAPSASPVRVDEGYLLGSGDRLKLDVFGVTEYSGEYTVMSDGTINLPLAGSVVVQGLTTRQAQDKIAARYSEWLTRPVITVILMQARPIQVAISGEVSRPGTYTTTVNDSGIPTLSRMIQMAGGINQSADLERVKILRRRPGQSTASQSLNVNLSQLLKSGDLTQDIQLRDGDTVVIPAAVALNLEDSNQLATSSLGASFDRPVNIVVAGQVNRPGPHSVRGENVPGTGAAGGAGQPQVAEKVKAPTVTRAIQIAGGITGQANIRDIEVKRLTRSGTEQTIKVNLMSLLQEGDSRQDIPLQDGDRIIIPQATALSAADAATMARASFSPDQITINVAGEVERPGPIQLPPNTTLNQAILAAGGFNRRASRGRVEFIRLLPNGAADRRVVAVDFNRGIDPQNNPQLLAGDTIVIRRNGFNTFLEGVGSVLGPALGLFGIFR